MNVERFHNELAMRLGYERIGKDKGMQISIEESNVPWVTLKILGYDEIKFKASDKAKDLGFETSPDIQDEIKIVRDAVRQAYVVANNCSF